jgi:2-hydroxycyclohexanecarboxyl-CoA dehydrogenase
MSEAPFNPKPFSESVVIITGGSSGIGLESAKEFVRQGVRKILLVGRNAERGEAAKKAVAAEASGAKVEFIASDITAIPGSRAVMDKAVAAFGGVDILLNSVGGDQTPELFHTMPIERIQETLVRYLSGPLQMCHLAVPIMTQRGGGVLLNVASDAAKFATPGESVIGAAMAGIVMFTRTMAAEGKRVGIRANAFTPSIVEGTRTHDRAMSPGFSGKLFAKAKQMAKLGVVQPTDIAPMIVFVASPKASKMTGQTISITGGISAG